MKKIIICLTIMLTVFSYSKVIHPSTTSLEEGKFTTLKVTPDCTLLEINYKKYKVNNDIVILAPGTYVFKMKAANSAYPGRDTTVTLEAGKVYETSIFYSARTIGPAKIADYDFNIVEVKE